MEKSWGGAEASEAEFGEVQQLCEGEEREGGGRNQPKDVRETETAGKEENFFTVSHKYSAEKQKHAIDYFHLLKARDPAGSAEGCPNCVGEGC